MGPLRCPVLIMGMAAVAFCQPNIPPRGIVNAASMTPPDLPGGAIARGSVFLISGVNLGPKTPAQVLAFPLQTALGGVSIKVSRQAASVDALPLSVSAGQIYAVMPSNAPLGRVSVVVTVSGVKSNPAPATVVANGFGIFSAASLNLGSAGSIGILTGATAAYGPGFLQNVNADGTATANALAVAAMPGQTVTLLGTGLGAIATSDAAAPSSDNLATPVEVFVGGEAAQVSSSGRSAYPGVDQVTFVLPGDVSTGCYVPIQVRTAGKVLSNSQTIAITADGSDCTPTLTAPQVTLATSSKLGLSMLLRAALHVDVEVTTPFDLLLDIAGAGFTAYAAGGFPYQAQLGLPSGTCATFTTPHDVFDPDQRSALLSGKTLNGGSSGTVTGAIASPLLFSDVKSHLLGALLGSGFPQLIKPFLDPGSYTVSTSGGADIGPAQIGLTLPAAINWTNRDQIGTIDRSQPLSLSWTTDFTDADPTQTVVVLGINVDIPTNSTAAFACMSAPGAAGLTVPAAILSALPASRFRWAQQKGVLFVAPVPSAGPPTFTAAGLDGGIAFPLVLSGKTVMFQ